MGWAQVQLDRPIPRLIISVRELLMRQRQLAGLLDPEKSDSQAAVEVMKLRLKTQLSILKSQEEGLRREIELRAAEENLIRNARIISWNVAYVIVFA